MKDEEKTSNQIQGQSVTKQIYIFTALLNEDRESQQEPAVLG